MGKIRKEDFGFSMPVNSSLYNGTIHFKDVEAFWVNYETDIEAIDNILPEGLVKWTPLSRHVF